MRRGAVLETAAILMASGAMLGFAASYLVTPRYVADATLSTPVPDARQLFRDAWSETLSRESLAPMILGSLSYKPRLDLISMDELLRRVRDGSVMTSADLPIGVTSVTIEFADEDRDAALETMRGLLVRLSDNAARLKPRIAHAPRVREAGPARGLFTGVGLGCGFLAALVVWFAATHSAEATPPHSERAA